MYTESGVADKYFDPLPEIPILTHNPAKPTILPPLSKIASRSTLVFLPFTSVTDVDGIGGISALLTKILSKHTSKHLNFNVDQDQLLLHR